MKWIEIKRDKQGFATEECLNEMFKHEMFVVRDKYNAIGYDGYFFVLKSRYWRGEIEINTSYTHYLPIPKVGL